MKHLIICAITISLLTTASISSTAQTKEEMLITVAGMNREMIELAKAGRYEAMGKFYDERAISLPNYRAMEKGYKLILNNNLGRKNGGYKIIEGQKTTTELIIGQDMMVDIGQYSLTVTFPGLAEPKTDMGKYMNVWKKDNESQWRIVAETWNADKSPNAPAVGKSQQPTTGTSTKPATGAPAQTGTQQKPVTESNEGKK
jgi:ketosteroid isomerase-like protein